MSTPLQTVCRTLLRSLCAFRPVGPDHLISGGALVKFQLHFTNDTNHSVLLLMLVRAVILYLRSRAQEKSEGKGRLHLLN